VRVAALCLVSALVACGTPAETPAPTPAATVAPLSERAAERASEAPPSAPPSMVTAETLGSGTPEQMQSLNLATALFNEGKLREAEDGYAKAAEGPVNGTSVSARLALADLWASRGAHDKAGPAFERLLDDARLIAEVQMVAGRYFASQGKDASARHALEAALVLQPDLLPALSLLGIVQARSGRAAEGAQTLAKYEARLERYVRAVSDMTTPPGDRIEAIKLLSTVVDERCVTALIRALRDPVPHVRLVAAQFLAEEDDPAALTALAESALSEADPESRIAMALIFKRARDRAIAETAAPPPSMPPPAAPSAR